MKDEHAFMLCIGIFAVAGVALVLYQHAMGTNSILQALGVASPSPVAASQGAMLGQSVSLAGTPSVTQSGSAQNPAVIPLNITPGGYIQ
jgi:hypothetical protein